MAGGNRESLNEKLAIVGIGCRFPGGIQSPNDFLNALCEGRNCISDIPADRWDIKAYYNSDREKPGKMYVKRGGFLENIALFEPSFFGISPREAAYMDPQQRILLEVVWEALEDGGIIPGELAGTKTGVYVGLFMHDYENMHNSPTESKLFGPHSPTGMSATLAANRISYVFDFKGPSMVIDTACSSSLVAVHLACRSLMNDETDVAIAAGVNLILKPEMTMVLCKGAFLSPDGKCKSFDASADGYVRSEGAAAIVIKKLSKAIADGDPIHAVICATAVNQDGKSEGMTVPSAQSQMEMMREALQQADLLPEDIHYVEAHGTGTSVGDPIEAQAIGSVFSVGRKEGNNLVIGSVKSNIGHTESTAGLAGLIKAVLAVEAGFIPMNLHFNDPNPTIPFDALQIRVPTTLEKWPAQEDKTRLAGVNSFGFGGTNAHVIIEQHRPKNCEEKQAYMEEKQEYRSKKQGKISKKTVKNAQKDENVLNTALITVSAHSENALVENIRALYDFIISPEKAENTTLADIENSLLLHRTHHAHRFSVPAKSLEELADKLKTFLSKEKTGESIGKAERGLPRKTVFVCSGMGSQWWAMGRSLWDKEPVFKRKVIECSHLFNRCTSEWSLIEELLCSETKSRMNRTEIAQPCIFTIQVALAALLESWGIHPDAVVGHSVGEVAACYISGALSLSDAVSVCYHRSRLQQQKAGTGTMLAVGLSAVEAEETARIFGKEIEVAAINSALSVTLSGEGATLLEIDRVLKKNNVFSKFVNTEVPYHSAYMDSILGELEEVLHTIKPLNSLIPIYSTAYGTKIEGKTVNAAYWVSNVRKPVQFLEAFREVLRDGYTVFIELGGHPVLASYMDETMEEMGKKGIIVHTLKRTEQADISLKDLLGKLYCAGYKLDYKKLSDSNAQFVRIPSYQWQRQKYWKESDESIDRRLGKNKETVYLQTGSGIHPILGSRLQSVGNIWNSTLSLDELPYLRDHKVQGSVIFPGAAFVEMALAAAYEQSKAYPITLKNFQIKAPLVIDKENLFSLQLLFDKEDSLAIYSRELSKKAQWIKHVEVQVENDNGVKKRNLQNASFEDLSSICKKESGKTECYNEFARMGLEYGICFRGIEKVLYNEKRAVSKVRISPAVFSEEGEYHLHPTLLDACFQTLALLERGNLYLPVSIGTIAMYDKPFDEVWCCAEVVKKSSTSVIGDISVYSMDGRLLVEIKKLECRVAGEGNINDGENLRDIVYEYKWLQDSSSNTESDNSNDNISVFDQCVDESCYARLTEEATVIFKSYNRERYFKEFNPQMKQLCALFILQAFCELNNTVESGMDVQNEAVPKYAKLLERLQLEKIESSANLEQSIIENKDPNKLWARMSRAFPEYHAELMLLRLCGSRLSDILRGQVDSLSLIFSPSNPAIDHFYHHSPTMQPYNQLLQRAVSLLLENKDNTSKLKILEIGAGTGSAASFILPVLPRHNTQYVFTDLSSAFLREAEQKFSSYPFIEYKLLDIEKPFQEQGFAPESFDIVIASNVIHATEDIAKSLWAVHKLLAPGGKLLLLEITSDIRWFDLVFGTLEGWWKFKDTKLRERYPTLSKDKWLKLLSSLGFDEMMASHDEEEGFEPLNTLFIARKAQHETLGETREELLSQGQEERPAWLIFGENNVVTATLKKKAEEAGSKVMFFNEKQVNNVKTMSAESLEQKIQEFIEYNFTKANPPVVLYTSGVEKGSDSISVETLEQDMQSLCFELMIIVKCLARQKWSSPPALWVVTAGTQLISKDRCISPVQATLWGIARVAVNEVEELNTYLVDLSLTPSQTEAEILFAKIIAQGQEDEVAIRGTTSYVHRLVKKEGNMWFENCLDKKPQAFSANITPFGKGEKINFVEKKRTSPGPGEIEAKVMATGVNFKDIAITSGLLEEAKQEFNTTIPGAGLEFSGMITAVGEGVETFMPGDCVMGLAHDCFDSHVIVDARMIVKKPDQITFDEAATVTVAFLSSYYALHELANIKKGDKVLIHTATGGVGLAAIQIAWAAGAEVFATAGTDEKRDYLKAMGIDYVGDSRSLKFADEIKTLLNGEGIDIVLNTLSGKAVEAGMSILKPVKGRFIDLSNIYRREFTVFSPYNGISVFTFEIETICQNCPEIIQDVLCKINEKLEEKVYHPVPYRAFRLSELSGMLRGMRKSIHIGKNIVCGDENPVVLPDNQEIKVVKNGTYLITGGLGGFGLATAGWLGRNGAGVIVLMSRRDVNSLEIMESKAMIEQTGAKVIIEKVDVTEEAQVKACIKRIQQTQPPIRGVFHAAMVLADTNLLEMDADHLKKVMRPKILGAWNLHQHTLNEKLDFFICFSSFAAVVGNAGQANYAAANCFLDAFVAYRKAQGLPATSIGWGAVAEAGYVSRNADITEHFRRQGLREISLMQAWKLITYVNNTVGANVSIISADWNVMRKYSVAVAKSPRFSGLLTKENDYNKKNHISKAISLQLVPPEERRKSLIDGLISAFTDSLGLEANHIQTMQPVSELGFDSLMAIELVVRIEALTGVKVPKMLLLKPHMSIEEIADIVEGSMMAKNGG